MDTCGSIWTVEDTVIFVRGDIIYLVVQGLIIDIQLLIIVHDKLVKRSHCYKYVV